MHNVTGISMKLMSIMCAVLVFVTLLIITLVVFYMSSRRNNNDDKDEVSTSYDRG